MKKKLRRIAFALLSIPFGLLKEFLLKTGRILLKHPNYLLMVIKRKLNRNTSFVILSNHPSLYETIIFVVLFWPKMIFYPSLIPISTPDETNFTKGKLFGFLGPLVKAIMDIVPKVSIARKNRNPEKIRDALSEIKRKLGKEKGRIFIIFGEGGRTSKEKNPKNLIFLENRKVRKFQKGIVRIIRDSEKDFYILPTFIEGAENVLPLHKKIPKIWRRMKIYFGKPLNTKDLKSKTDFEILEILQNAVLNS